MFFLNVQKFIFGSLLTRLLFIGGELSRGGSVAVSVDVSDI